MPSPHHHPHPPCPYDDVAGKHIDEIGKNEELAEAGVTALRMFVAGDESGMIAGAAADVAHTMTTAMTK